MPPRRPETIQAIKDRVLRKCSECQKEKEKKLFHKDKNNIDGLYPVCKECRKNRCHTSYLKNKEKILKSCKEYRKTDKGKETRRKEYKAYVKRHPEKHNARNIFSKAIRAGKVIQPEFCSICNQKCLIQGHHEDYSKPLDVIWCCHLCHTDIHNNKRKKEE